MQAAEPTPKLEVHYYEGDHDKSLLLELNDLIDIFSGGAGEAPPETGA